MLSRNCHVSYPCWSPVEEPVCDAEQLSDHTSSYVDEGEVSDLESSSLDREELLDVDQKFLLKKHTETMGGVRPFMGWNAFPEFDLA